MSVRLTARRWSWLVFALFAAVSLTASPASAASSYGTYTNYTTKKIEGNYTWVDCGGCPDDHSVTVSNYKNGYHVRVQLQIDVYANDVFSTYLDRYANDGYTGKWKAPSGTPRGQARLRFCYYNLSWNKVGSCDTTYFWHSK